MCVLNLILGYEGRLSTSGRRIIAHVINYLSNIYLSMACCVSFCMQVLKVSASECVLHMVAKHWLAGPR